MLQMSLAALSLVLEKLEETLVQEIFNVRIFLIFNYINYFFII